MNKTTSSDLFGLPRFVVWGGGLFLLLLAFFFVGFQVGARPIDDLTARVERAEVASQDSETRAEALEARLHGQRALSLLYRTMLDVDARNFGTANERLDEVSAALAEIDHAAIGLAAEDLDALRRDLEELDLRVADDLAVQRSILSDLAQRLVELLGV